MKCCAIHQSIGRAHSDPIHDTCQNTATVERGGRPYCNRHDPEAKASKAEAKRLAALPRDAVNSMSDACASLRYAALCMKELGCEDVAAELYNLRLLIDRQRLNAPASIAAAKVAP